MFVYICAKLSARLLIHIYLKIKQIHAKFDFLDALHRVTNKVADQFKRNIFKITGICFLHFDVIKLGKYVLLVRSIT